LFQQIKVVRKSTTGILLLLYLESFCYCYCYCKRFNVCPHSTDLCRRVFAILPFAVKPKFAWRVPSRVPSCVQSFKGVSNRLCVLRSSVKFLNRYTATQTALPVFVSTNKSCTQKYNLLLLLLLLYALMFVHTAPIYADVFSIFYHSLSIWGEAPTIPIETRICVAGTLAGTITCAKFQRGCNFTGGRISHIAFCMGFTTLQR